MAADALARISAALHPLDPPPRGPGWNLHELEGLGDPEAACAVEAAVLVGLVPRDGALRVLLTRRNDGLRNHAGQVSFPGGRLDPDDAGPVQGAMRETWEEVGIEPARLWPMGCLDPFATITGFRVVPVVARVDPGYVARPDPGEVAEVFEVPLDYLLDPANLAARRFRVGERERTVWEYRYPAQRIWGATASILLNLRHRLQDLP